MNIGRARAIVGTLAAVTSDRRDAVNIQISSTDFLTTMYALSDFLDDDQAGMSAMSELRLARPKAA